MSVSFCFTILYFPLFVNCKYSIKQYKIFLKIPRLKSGHGYLCNTRAGMVLTRGTKETYYNHLQLLPAGISLIVYCLTENSNL